MGESVAAPTCPAIPERAGKIDRIGGATSARPRAVHRPERERPRVGAAAEVEVEQARDDGDSLAEREAHDVTARSGSRSAAGGGGPPRGRARRSRRKNCSSSPGDGSAANRPKRASCSTDRYSTGMTRTVRAPDQAKQTRHRTGIKITPLPLKPVPILPGPLVGLAERVEHDDLPRWLLWRYGTRADP